MTSDFAADVEASVGPLLKKLGFVIDGVDNGPDEGGIARHIVFDRSNDCKLQIFDSSREGEVNCMIAPLNCSESVRLDDQRLALHQQILPEAHRYFSARKAPDSNSGSRSV